MKSVAFLATGDSVDPQLIEHLKSPSFAAYNFDKKIVETLTKLGFRSPTNIQVLKIVQKI